MCVYTHVCIYIFNLLCGRAQGFYVCIREFKKLHQWCLFHLVIKKMLKPYRYTYFAHPMFRHWTIARHAVTVMQTYSHAAQLHSAEPWMLHSQSQWGLFMLLPLMNFKALFPSLLFYFYLNCCNLVCSNVKHLFSWEGSFEQLFCKHPRVRIKEVYDQMLLQSRVLDFTSRPSIAAISLTAAHLAESTKQEELGTAPALLITHT